MIPWLKIAPYIAGALAIAALLGYVRHSGVISGRHDVQVKFDAFIAAQTALVIKEQQEADAKEAAAKKANDAILADYQARLGSSAAYSHDLAVRLRDAIARAGSNPVPESQDQPGTAGAGQTPSATGIAGLIGNALSECRDNAAQLDALRDELIPQL